MKTRHPDLIRKLLAGPRLIGVLLIVSAGLWNPSTIGWLMAEGEEIGDPLPRKTIVIGQCAVAGIGLILLFWPARFKWPKWLRVTTLCGAIVCAAAGVVLMAQWLELIPPPQVTDLTKINETIEHVRYMALGDQYASAMELRLATLETPRLPSPYEFQLRQDLGNQRLRRGEIDEAIAQFQRAYEIAVEMGRPKSELNRVSFRLGLAHLRQGETKHCLQFCNRESCLFPIREQGIWPNRQPALRAIHYFEQCLRSDPADVRARWLLNIAHMVSGSSVDEIPTQLRARLALFDSDKQVPEFRNIAAELGVDTFDLCGGSLMDDVDHDGYLDLISSSYQPDKSLAYYHNNGDGTFSDWTSKAGLQEQYGGFNIVQADYNNDGLLDILVLRGAWLGRYGRIRNSLLRQNADKTFTDVTQQAGLGGRAYPTLAGAWADYDLDGDVDLYLANERLAPNKCAPSQLFRNNGDGTFTEIGWWAGVRNGRNGKGVAWGDIDNDGDPDLFVANYADQNRLYRNEGDGSFTDIAPQLRVDKHGPRELSFATWFYDVNNDGWLDLFLAGYVVQYEHAVSNYFGLAARADRLKIFLNDGTGHLKDASASMGLDVAFATMAANFGDIDNDGFLDIYLGTGAPPLEYLVPNVMLRNIAGKRFEDVTAAARVGHLQKGHGIAFGDLDNDGDQDIYAQLGGFVKDDRFYNAMFQNPGNANSWITLNLIGTTSNRAALGTRIRVVAETPQGDLNVHRVVGSGGSFGASSLQQEIGLGGATRVKLIEVIWPASGTRQQFSDLAVNQFLRITEGESEYATQPRRPITLDSSSDMARVQNR